MSNVTNAMSPTSLWLMKKRDLRFFNSAIFSLTPMIIYITVWLGFLLEVRSLSRSSWISKIIVWINPLERTSFSFTRSDVMKIRKTKKKFNDYEITKNLFKNLKFTFQLLRIATITGFSFDSRIEIHQGNRAGGTK